MLCINIFSSERVNYTSRAGNISFQMSLRFFSLQGTNKEQYTKNRMVQSTLSI